MCTGTQDRQYTPARSASKTSLAMVPATCVQDVRIGYIQDVLVFGNAADYRKANGWICTACMTPPQPRAPSPPPSPAHTPIISDKTFNILQWNANGIGNKQTELSIFLEAHNVKVAAIQESKLTAKSRSPNIQNYTLVSQDRHQGPGGALLFFIHNSVSFTHKTLSTTSKNDPPPRRTDHQHRYG